MNNKQWDKLEITWLDSHHTNGWKYANDLIKDLQTDEGLEHTTIGYFLLETQRSFSIVQSRRLKPYFDGDWSVDASMTIPKVAIIKIKKL